MVVVDPVRAWMIIPKVTVAVIFFVAGVLIYRKRDYVLNKIFLVAFCLWGVYNSLDAISSTFAAASPEWYVLCSVLWAIELFCLQYYAFLILNAALVIKNGEQSLKPGPLVIQLVLFTLLGVLLTIFAPLQVVEPQGNVIPPETLPPKGDFSIAEAFSPVSLVIAAIPFVVYFISAAIMYSAIKAVEDSESKRHMVYLLIGMLFIPAGLIYFLLRNTFFPVYSITFSTIGQAIFIGAPVFIYLSQKKKHPSEKTKSDVD